MAINTCVISAKIRNLADVVPVGIDTTLAAKLHIKNDRSFMHGNTLIGPFEITSDFDVDGETTLEVIETDTPGERLEIYVTLYEGPSKRVIAFEPVVIPNQASIDLGELTVPKRDSF